MVLREVFLADFKSRLRWFEMIKHDHSDYKQVGFSSVLVMSVKPILELKPP